MVRLLPTSYDEKRSGDDYTTTTTSTDIFPPSKAAAEIASEAESSICIIVVLAETTHGGSGDKDTCPKKKMGRCGLIRLSRGSFDIRRPPLYCTICRVC